ncbi:uncharacterized protein LOC142978345 [Anticarsia gemmatalis]|uniref:uncharacterized protein LOC142978345 n=1 Tax=Anticarsia gemmatalis TaxID=129554 RepID=UPI003F760771
MKGTFSISVIFFSYYYVIKTVNSQCQFAQTCVHDRTIDDCWGAETLEPGLTVFGCCPGCQAPSGVTSTTPGFIPEDEGCQPPSNCLPDGTFAPVQCKGDLFTGRCFCTNANGVRIFGQMWRSEADDMTCACSRRRAELEVLGSRVITLHCTASGDYEPLQCDDGMCWCAQPSTGQPTVTPVPEADMTRLPCYSAAVIGTQYLRQCESLVLAIAMIKQEQSEHGTNFLGSPSAFCDYDGSYGPYQIQNGIAYCTGRDGKILGAWQVISSEMTGMTCNCARDTMIYFPEHGMVVTETCLANGNYRPTQNVGDVHYCVDSDGYAIEFLDEKPADNYCEQL